MPRGGAGEQKLRDSNYYRCTLDVWYTLWWLPFPSKFTRKFADAGRIVVSGTTTKQPYSGEMCTCAFNIASLRTTVNACRCRAIQITLQENHIGFRRPVNTLEIVTIRNTSSTTSHYWTDGQYAQHVSVRFRVKQKSGVYTRYGDWFSFGMNLEFHHLRTERWGKGMFLVLDYVIPLGLIKIVRDHCRLAQLCVIYCKIRFEIRADRLCCIGSSKIRFQTSHEIILYLLF